MRPRELARLCNQPGYDGVLWRLVRAWDPDGVGHWMVAERRAGASPDMMCAALAEVLATAAFLFALKTTDPAGAVKRLDQMVGQRLQAKLNDHGGKVVNIVVPKLPSLIVPS